MIGYRTWFYYAERQSDAAMEARLDKNQYDENDLVSLSIPLDNPYLLEQKAFERVNGEISFQGKSFKYVKRRVSNGNLILICIPDAHKMVFKKVKTELGDMANDLQSPSKGSSKSGLQKSFNGSDYIDQFANVLMCRCANSFIIHSTFIEDLFTDPLMAPPGKPPRFMA
jgi:hypothetical protein